jgi:hypothetical protein
LRAFDGTDRGSEKNTIFREIMTNDTDEDEDEEAGMVTRSCEHCEWTVSASSYASLVTAYQDHLREEHEKAWLRT